MKHRKEKLKKQRAEIKKRYNENGIKYLDDQECLELLLQYVVDENEQGELAYELISYLGTLNGVLEAEHEELARINGISDHIATLIEVIPSVARSLAMDRMRVIIGKKFETIVEVGQFCVNRYIGITDERLSVILLDEENAFLDFKTIQIGSLGAANINLEKLAEYVFGYKVSSFILVHNHPGGRVIPSMADIDTTMFAKKYFISYGKVLLEHIIVSGNRYLPILKYCELNNFD